MSFVCAMFAATQLHRPAPGPLAPTSPASRPRYLSLITRPETVVRVIM